MTSTPLCLESFGLEPIEPMGGFGSVSVDNICEASGSVQSTAQQQAGLYTLTISGTKVGGGSVDLSVPFTIVSFVMPTPATSSSPRRARPRWPRACPWPACSR